MNIDEMNDEEKSVLLAKAMGNPISFAMPGNSDDTTAEYPFNLNLYDAANMALAWRVLNWANEQHAPDPQEEYIADEVQEYMRFFGAWLSILPPDEAQRNILDKILSLAIEAGLVKLDKETQ